MAEVFGTVAAALGVAALFNNCVDTFEYIQLGRHFGDDYTLCKVRLVIAETRLIRWGEVAKINDNSRFDASAPLDKQAKLVQMILQELASHFERVQRTSERYKLGADQQQDLVLLRENNMQKTGLAVYNQLKDFARRKQRRTGLLKKTAWALYDGKHLKVLIDEIADLIDDLEKVFPVEDGEDGAQRLLETEIEEVKDEASLTLLKDAAKGIDKAMSDAAARKIDTIVGRNSAREIKTVDEGKVQVGHSFATETLAAGMHFRDETVNSVGVVTASGKSGVQIGNSYGGRGLFDGR
ncbi:hypothetical protein SBRCBS47491_000915 [Sporothrix bragantina]|uniref:Prion-inhibition and propagation HeLo domain-containing protein n=1 Tax=Sporothrix bragantina TaxID=671064 RepID=A0ABP0AUB2_9PEZI